MVHSCGVQGAAVAYTVQVQQAEVLHTRQPPRRTHQSQATLAYKCACCAPCVPTLAGDISFSNHSRRQTQESALRKVLPPAYGGDMRCYRPCSRASARWFDGADGLGTKVQRVPAIEQKRQIQPFSRRM